MRSSLLLALFCFAAGIGFAAAGPPDRTPSLDRYGDPLPAGAFARLGTVRFRVPGPIDSASWSGDGKTLLVTTMTQKVHVLDGVTGKTLKPFGFPAGMAASSVAISADGTLLAGQDERGVVHLLDLSTGRLHPPLGLVRDFSLQLEFSRNGRVLVAGANASGIREEDCPVRAWDVASGKQLGPFRMRPCSISRAAVSPDGKILAGWGEHPFHSTSGSSRKRQTQFDELQLWELPSAREMPRLSCRTESIPTVVFSPDGTRLAVANTDGVIQLFDPRTGTELKRFGHTRGKNDQAALTEDQKIERDLKQLARRMLEEQSDERGPAETIRCMRFSADGKRLVSASSAEAVVWDASRGVRLGGAQALPGQPGDMMFVDDRVNACSSCGAAVRVWGMPPPKEPPHPVAHFGAITSVAFFADDRSVASSSATGEVFTWDVASQRGSYRAIGGENATVPPSPEGNQASAVSPDAKYLVRLGKSLTDAEQQRIIEKMISESASSERIKKAILAQPLRVNDIDSGRMLHEVDIDVFAQLVTGFSSEGRVALSAGISTGAKASVALWDGATGQVKRRFPSERALDAVAVSGDGGRVAVASTSMDSFRLVLKSGDEELPKVVLYEARSGEEISSFSATVSSSHALAFSDDGSRLAIGTRDGLIVLRNATTGKRLGTIGGASDGQVGTLLFSPDGRMLAATMTHAANTGSRIQVIEMANGGLRRDFECAVGEITSLAFSHHVGMLASGAADSTVLLWDLTGRRAAPPPTADDVAPGAMERLWSQLSAPDARTGYEAVVRLLETPGATVSLLRAKMKAETEKPPTHAEIVEMIRKLDDARFSVRDTAAERLLDAAERAKEPLEQSLEQTPSPETRGRLTRLIKSIELCHASRNRLRLIRAVEVLEGLGTREARELLKDLAEGRPDARLTREANASLARLARQRR